MFRNLRIPLQTDFAVRHFRRYTPRISLRWPDNICAVFLPTNKF